MKILQTNGFLYSTRLVSLCDVLLLFDVISLNIRIGRAPYKILTRGWAWVSVLWLPVLLGMRVSTSCLSVGWSRYFLSHCWSAAAFCPRRNQRFAGDQWYLSILDMCWSVYKSHYPSASIRAVSFDWKRCFPFFRHIFLRSLDNCTCKSRSSC